MGWWFAAFWLAAFIVARVCWDRTERELGEVKADRDRLKADINRLRRYAEQSLNERNDTLARYDALTGALRSALSAAEPVQDETVPF